MRRAIALFFALVLILLPWPGREASAQDADFQIVVHESVQESELEAKQLSKLFLKKVKRWEDDSQVVVYDLVAESEVRDAFSRAVHRKSISSIKSYWQRMIFSGRDVAPDEVENAAEMLEKIRTTPGAVGYVAAGETLPDGVKVLTIKEK